MLVFEHYFSNCACYNVALRNVGFRCHNILGDFGFFGLIYAVDLYKVPRSVLSKYLSLYTQSGVSAYYYTW